MTRREMLLAVGACVQLAPGAVPQKRPFPRMQAVPLPDDQISLERDDKEIARYHFGALLNRPFVFPIIGPSGRTLTRMGHPGDPYSHSHHNSVWISYAKVNGVDFWADRGRNHGRIVHQKTIDLIDSDIRAGIISESRWISDSGVALLSESRETWAYPLMDGEWMLVIDLKLEAMADEVSFDRAGFGPIGVRVAKPLSVHFGGGVIRNSENAEGEPAVFRKPARWVDYSGWIAPEIQEGLTLFDHPLNLSHPSPFHVREDGWMGAMLSTERAVTVARGRPLYLRYGLFVHSGMPETMYLNTRWQEFANLDLHPPSGPPANERDCLHGGHRGFNTPRTFASTKECLDFVRRLK